MDTPNCERTDTTHNNGNPFAPAILFGKRSQLNANNVCTNARRQKRQVRRCVYLFAASFPIELF